MATSSAVSYTLEALFRRHDMDGAKEPGTFPMPEPIDGVLWAHILITGFAFGILFPVGMVLSINKHRLQLPVQITGCVFAITGLFLVIFHKGGKYPSGNIYSVFGGWVMLIVFCQVAISVALSLNRREGFLGRIRRTISRVHTVLACIIPAATWVEMGFGVIVLENFCHADHLGQCLAHGIMGSSFIAYGYFLAFMLYFGDNWLNNRGKSQEFYDSSVITLWGIVNTFTEHRWGQSWSHGDYQHTSMGIIWWCAGMVGIVLSRNWSTGEPKRNHIPALVLIFTGWAMSEHAQHLVISTKVHAFFGYVLMGAGLARIIEISFILKDGPSDSKSMKAFQHLPPFLLVESGICFIGANEEQLELLNNIGVDFSSYLLVLSSCGFLLYLLILSLLTLHDYLRNSHTNEPWKTGHIAVPSRDSIELEDALNANEYRRRSDDLDSLED